ncbi:uncharacterized protein [Hoplias malabaricus]|uniref:uncharacterized protein n=1 Tax=Hoplias malabaricus TaxID=27720 RepID=UPI003461B32F
MIARGFVPSRAKNPWAVHPSYEYWAPWIGRHTRKGDCVLNTEYEKVLPVRESPEAELFMITEERLMDELKKQKVGTVRKLCKACHIDPRGSRDDLIVRLQQEMKNRHTYDKVFQKIWGASGGWCVIACPHGVVYSLKFNLRAESPRDFTDLLLSWKHIPNVSVYDFARGLATHANLRFPAIIPFKPHEGRLAEPTPENISAAQKGKLEVSLSWLVERSPNSDGSGHPITGASSHYVLYDKLHESNTKDQRDILRRINLVPELQGSLNSQIAEQLFGSMRKNNYFLNNMSPSTHVFLMRNIIHHRNTSVNFRLLETQLKRGLMDQRINNITLNELGQAVLASTHTQQSGVMSVEQGSPEPMQPQTLVSSCDDEYETCGMQCEARTKFQNIKPSRAFWSLTFHSDQEKLLSYVLDEQKPRQELIVKKGKICLVREDFWTLGLPQDMEATVGNACLSIIDGIARAQGRNIFIANIYVVPTWLPPCNADPLDHLPYDAQLKEALVIPLWTSGHYILSVLKPAKREILFLDPMFTKRTESRGFGDLMFQTMLSNLAQMLNPGQWEEKTGWDLQDLPIQHWGNDCGIFMLMYALYVVLDGSFDFTVHDMPMLRKWWCVMIMENFEIEGYGKRFAHWTDDAKALLKGHLQPVFRVGEHVCSQEPLPPVETEQERKSTHHYHCLALDIYACVYQRIGKKSMYSEVQSVNWVQCQYCGAQLHADCAGVETLQEDVPFSCGCHRPEPYLYKRTYAAIREGSVINHVTDEEILTLQRNLQHGILRSNRMFLHENPTFHPKMKQIRDGSISVFDEEQTEAIIERTFEVIKCNRASLKSTSFVLEVMTPEITILLLRKLEGFSRYEAENVFSRVAFE